MELTEIRYFLAVCETLNFSRAADHCHVTQPALSRAVQKLELELGSQLFCRDKARVQLTGIRADDAAPSARHPQPQGSRAHRGAQLPQARGCAPDTGRRCARSGRSFSSAS